MGGIVTTTNVVAEDVHVQTIGRRDEIDNPIHILLGPVSYLSCPPAKGGTPTFQLLITYSRIDLYCFRPGSRLCSQRPCAKSQQAHPYFFHDILRFLFILINDHTTT